MKLEIENAGVWHLNASIWAFKHRGLLFMKSTPEKLGKQRAVGVKKITNCVKNLKIICV